MFKIRFAKNKEKISRDLLTFLEWGKPLSKSQYLLRQTQLRNTKWASKNQRTILLYDTKSKQVLASCDIYFLKNSKNTKLVGIANLVTEKKIRSRGYATKLLRLVCEHLEKKVKNLSSIYLFSEVGEAFYKKIGFVSVNRNDILLNHISRTEIIDPDYKQISSLKQLCNIVKEYNKIQKKYFVDFNHLLWHYKRQNFYKECLEIKDALPFGYILKNGSFVLAFIDYKSKSIKILLMFCTDEASFRSLIYLLKKDLAKIKFKSILLYEKFYKESLKFCTSAKVIQKSEDGILMVRGLRNHKKFKGMISRLIWI